MSPEPDKDRRLVERFLSRRDEPSFSALYARHAGAVFALASRLSGSAADGEDILQDVWVRAAERLGAFRWESSLRTWLGGIVVHRWREIERQRRRRPQTEELDGEPSDRGVGDEPAALLDLEAALRSLPEGYREVVVLHDVNDYTHAEIAALLEIEEGTSKSQPLAEEVSGFFVIEAKDLDAAIAVARTCPHLRHGGRITVRAIAPV